MVYNDNPVTLIDTAGIRKRAKSFPVWKKFSVIRSMNAIERADVAILMIDATTIITARIHTSPGIIKDLEKCDRRWSISGIWLKKHLLPL